MSGSDVAAEAEKMLRDARDNPGSVALQAYEDMAVRVRDKRDFELLERFTEPAFDTPQCDSLTLARLHAQALIEQNRLDTAIAILGQLADDAGREGGDLYEYREAKGLLGRAHKQIYLAAKAQRMAPEAGAKRDGAGNAGSIAAQVAGLMAAIAHYRAGFRAATPGEPHYAWLGMNVAALCRLAEIEGLVAPATDPESAGTWQSVARDVERAIADEWASKGTTSAWNCATAGEAALAIQDYNKAKDWFLRYVGMADENAFALHSTLRQLREVWRIDHPDSGYSKEIVDLYRLLEARLVIIEGGKIPVGPRAHDHANTTDRSIQAEVLATGHAHGADPDSAVTTERMIGAGEFWSLERYRLGLDRAAAIARIGALTDIGHGTGFLVAGAELHPKLAGHRLLVTNAHVLSNDQKMHRRGALRRDEALVTFAADATATVYRISRILWTSPFDPDPSHPETHDCTIALLDQQPPEELGIIPIAPTLPSVTFDPAVAADREVRASERVYIIGHPRGGPLMFSKENNDLIEHNHPMIEGHPCPPCVRLRYQTPTEPGSSGSPVLYGPQFKLIGIHHASNGTFRPFAAGHDHYEANQAIWIGSIREAIKNALFFGLNDD